MAKYFCSFLENIDCGEGFFNCADRKMCIVDTQACNGIANCPDGSDEKNCGKRDLFAITGFLYHSFVVDL